MSSTLFHSEMEKFKKTFFLIGYSATLVDSCIKSFLDKMYNSPDITDFINYINMTNNMT